MNLEETISKIEPKLHVTPTYLDFGIFNPNIHSVDHGRLAVTITNSGGGILAGRINPQVTWISVTPSSFRCAPGQSVEHVVHLKPDAPKSWKPQKFSFDLLFLINSNGGSSLLGGSYIINIEKPKPEPLPTWIWIAAPALLIIFVTLAVIWSLFFRPAEKLGRVPDQNTLYTQGASTVLAQLTKPPSSISPDAVSLLFTQGAQTVMAQINTPAPASYNETPSPNILLGQDTPSSAPFETPAPGSELTFTPWPRDQFQNPELFVRDYYSTLNYRNYQKAWSMLSPHFQQNCCNVGGNDPFIVYSNYWNTMNRVDVLSAYIQQWDTNPAVLIVSLRYQTKDQNTIDTVNTFKLIANAEQKTLMIDEVQ